MNHKILAKSERDARRLATAINDEGLHARHTKFGKHHVVLAIAPTEVVETLSARVGFEAGCP